MPSCVSTSMLGIVVGHVGGAFDARLVERLALGNEGVGPAAAQHALAHDGLLPRHGHSRRRPRRRARATSRAAGTTGRARRPRACRRSAPACRWPSRAARLRRPPRNCAARAGRSRRRETCCAAVTFDGSSPSSLRRGIAIRRLHLRAQPQVAAVGAHVGQAVERLHGRMREIGQFVFHVDALRRAAQARLSRCRCRAPRRPAVSQQPLVLAALRGGGETACWALRPTRSASASRPRFAAQVLVPYTATPAGITLTSTTPGTARAALSSTLRELRADHRRPRDDGEQHARHAHVDAELRAAIHLHRRIEALLRLAEVAEAAPGP